MLTQKYMVQCGQEESKGLTGHYGKLYLEMKSRDDQLGDVVEKTLSTIDDEFDQRFKEEAKAVRLMSDKLDERDCLEMAHFIRLQREGEEIMDTTVDLQAMLHQLKQGKFKSSIQLPKDFATIKEIENNYDKNKILCKGCPQADVPNKFKIPAKILKDKLDLNDYKTTVQQILNNPSSKFEHPRRKQKNKIT